MEIRVLGCSGGIGGRLRTTALLIDGHTLIDAGTGVGDLTLEELRAVDRVFVTHSHLDHIALLPLMIDSVGASRETPIEVYATAETLAILREHIFNWRIWPDFSRIPTPEAPCLRFVTLEEGVPVALPGGLAIRSVPALHTVPAVGYHVSGPGGSLVFTGDTTVNPAFWPVVNAIADLRVLIIETAFCERERAIAEASRHLSSAMLAGELAQLRSRPQVYITHLKPGEYDLTMQEVLALAADFEPRMLQEGLLIQV